MGESSELARDDASLRCAGDAVKGTLPPETFRIRPKKRSRRFFVVHIPDDLDALRAAMVDHTGQCHPEQIAAVVSAKSHEFPGLIGVIYVPRTHLGVGLVAHELSHAAFRAIERDGERVEHWTCWEQAADDLGNGLTNAAEEHYCNVAEYLNRSFWREIYRLGLATPDARHET